MDINLILLSIAIEITKDKEQREYLEKQYQQFLIFCILSSININTSVANYDLIQLILYNILLPNKISFIIKSLSLNKLDK